MTTHTIIIGSGSSGGVLASRLSEDPDQQVVLIEAGRDYPDPKSMPDSIRNAHEVITAEHDWGFNTYLIEPPNAREQYGYGRGRVVGGSSSVNQAVAQRATTADGQRWAAAGLSDWSWDHLLPYYRKMETDEDFGSTTDHGGKGPVRIRRGSAVDWPPFGHAMQKAAQSFGFPLVDDLSAPGSHGFGPSSSSTDATGARMGSLAAYLSAARGRHNLTIMPETTCTKVLFEGKTAVGVEVDRGDGPETLAADRVVVAAGSFKSAQLLMLSGIGRPANLTALGITPLVANDNVGRNMTDHPIAMVVSSQNGEEGHSLPHLIYTTETGQKMGYFNDLGLWPGIGDPGDYGFPMVSGTGSLGLLVQLTRPTSLGWMDVVSGDIRDQPEIHLNFLDTDEDMQRMKESVRLACRFATSQPVANEFLPLLTPTLDEVDDDAALESWLRRTVVPALHSTSACRMGTDPSVSVVDQRFAVHGVSNLFVADSSALYDVPSASPNITSMLIGERMADWLLAK